jgi:5-methylthioribose kinase
LFELNPGNAADYLNGRHGIARREWRITPLGGGVSNTVLFAESGGERMVLKQSLPKLRVDEDWPADRNRIQREWLAMQDLAPHLPARSVPEVYFVDEPNFLFAMEAAPDGALTWKDQLLDGAIEAATAERVASMLAGIFRASWKSPVWERDFGDLTVFEQLRLDPYHGFTASRHPDLAEHFRARAEEARSRRFCAVHGDWSPKNFLVSPAGVMAIDFEVIHFGDPSFDVAFLLNHLMLKALHRPRWANRYAALAERFRDVLVEELPAGAEWIEPAACKHLGCLLLARIDGKSPAEYIQDDEQKRQVRGLARRLIASPPVCVKAAFEKVQS